MGLTLLAQSSLSPQYWVDAFLTLVFLINRLPSKVLDNKTPYFILHKTEPLYKDLHVFWCACYPLLPPYTEHKLAFRSKKCLFLGYSNCEKGYRCLDLRTKRVYISRHVIFDEQSFLAQELANHTTSRSTTPAAGKPLIIPSSVISSTLLSNVSAAIASQANPTSTQLKFQILRHQTLPTPPQLLHPIIILLLLPF